MVVWGGREQHSMERTTAVSRERAAVENLCVHNDNTCQTTRNWARWKGGRQEIPMQRLAWWWDGKMRVVEGVHPQ